MRIERVEGVLLGQVSSIYRSRPRYVINPKPKKTSKSSGDDSFAVLFEKAISNLAKSLMDAGKITYGKYGVARDYDEILGTLFDEKA